MEGKYTSRLGSDETRDLTILLNNDTSRKGRNVIQKLNEEMRNKNNMSIFNRTTNELASDPLRSSGTLRRSGLNVLGMAPDDPTDVSVNNKSAITTRTLGASPLDGRPGSALSNPPRIGSSKSINQPPATTGLNFNKPAFPTINRLDITGYKNPNVELRGKPLGEADQKEVNTTRLKELESQRNKQAIEYVSSVVKKIEDIDNRTKNFKEFDKVELDRKDEEIRKWLIIQKKVDEERRVETENRLRLIFKDKENFSTHYSPTEGFLLEIDFMMTYFSRFEDVYIRYAVYLIGDKISPTFKTGYHMSENYLANMNRIFMGEQQVIENIDNDREVFVIFEIINITNQSGVKSHELVGWTVLRIFDDNEGFL